MRSLPLWLRVESMGVVELQISSVKTVKWLLSSLDGVGIPKRAPHRRVHLRVSKLLTPKPLALRVEAEVLARQVMARSAACR